MASTLKIQCDSPGRKERVVVVVLAVLVSDLPYARVRSSIALSVEGRKDSVLVDVVASRRKTDRTRYRGEMTTILTLHARKIITTSSHVSATLLNRSCPSQLLSHQKKHHPVGDRPSELLVAVVALFHGSTDSRPGHAMPPRVRGGPHPPSPEPTVHPLPSATSSTESECVCLTRTLRLGTLWWGSKSHHRTGDLQWRSRRGAVVCVCVERGKS